MSSVQCTLYTVQKLIDLLVLNFREILKDYLLSDLNINNSGHSLIVDLLINAGAELDMVDCDGKTALHLACSENHYEVVVQLLRYTGRGFF